MCRTIWWTSCLSVVIVLLCATPGSAQVDDEHEAFGNIRLLNTAKGKKPPPASPDNLERWNTIAVDATGLDHTPLSPGESRHFGEQIGPARSARAMAVVHIAMFEALNAIAAQFPSYVQLKPVDKAKKVSASAALATAAHDTLAALFPSQKSSFDAQLAEDLALVKKADERNRGTALGQSAAAAILALRQGDGAQHDEPNITLGEFTPLNDPGKWRQDPISQIPIALGARWAMVQPFIMSSAAQFRSPPPPPLGSSAYTSAYNEAKRLGGDGVTTATTRTADQTQSAVFWAYDGTPALCAPPRLYNQITLTIARQQKTTGFALARLLALVNVALADTALAVWETKYFYQLWRPITAIRESDPGTGPTGAGDGNADTAGDPAFSPLGAPASNLLGPNFTPPFPAYPSGHAGFGGALFQVLRTFYGTDAIAFTFTSDEYNGVTRGADGQVRPLQPRSFASLSAAEEENGQSRIYLGIHWSFDKTEGIAQGHKVADLVGARLYRAPVACTGNACSGDDPLAHP